jgi:hypothetical protein
VDAEPALGLERDWQQQQMSSPVMKYFFMTPEMTRPGSRRAGSWRR